MIVSNDADCSDFAKAVETEVERTNAVIEKRSALPKLQPQS